MRSCEIFLLRYLRENGYRESYDQLKEDLSSKWLKNDADTADKVCQTESQLHGDHFISEKSLEDVLKMRYQRKTVACQASNEHCCQSKEVAEKLEKRVASMQRTISYLREELRKRPDFEKPPPKIAIVRPQRFNPFKKSKDNPAK
ncbi:Oidioi.mRNA.OKI2018_I69.XSR.g16185.t1.cds [Oikopleura dioica]|uniref:Oidioi.mRNA.OKI2018_I69.XSR.g16185.t1.cds n=1 Tax=Oikopleura dioica TaxID=34765 RepID=A0ABN7SML6_OIKDI|nr:Oidioi.mRNA.OKI2018_I69.XSR.g16185.t1.cds [Oikopleura dioica]